MDNYEVMKPWEHGKIVEIHHDIKSISVYPIVYENKDFYVCRMSGSTEVIIIRKHSNTNTNLVFESYEKYVAWKRNNTLLNFNGRRFFVHIPKNEKISFADNFPVRDALDEALAKAEFAYEEQKKVLDRLKTIKKEYLSKIEKVEKELENKKTNLNNIRAKIAERDGKNSGF